MSIRRLKMFIAVAESGSFGAAADEVGVSQSAVSLQMKALEEELRIDLFDRSTRPPVLNRKGLELVKCAREIVDGYERLGMLAGNDTEPTGELRIGGMSTTMTGIIPQAITSLRRTYPSLRILVTPDHSPNLVPQVDRGKLDAAIISAPPYFSEHMEFHRFTEEPMVAIAPLDCPCDDPIELLRTYPFIRFNRIFWAGQVIDEWLRRKNVIVNEQMELDSLDMVSTMVYYGLGVSIVPSRCVASPNPLALKEISLGPKAPKRVLGMLVRRDNKNRHLTDLFYEQMLNVIKAHADPALKI